MIKDLLLIVLVSVVWRSASTTYIINDEDDFDLFSDTRLRSFHYTSPDLGSPLYQSQNSEDYFGDHDDDQRLRNLFSDGRIHQQAINAFPRLIDGIADFHSSNPHLSNFHGTPQQFHEQHRVGQDVNSYQVHNLNQQQIEVVPKDRNSYQVHNLNQQQIEVVPKDRNSYQVHNLNQQQIEVVPKDRNSYQVHNLNQQQIEIAPKDRNSYQVQNLNQQQIQIVPKYNAGQQQNTKRQNPHVSQTNIPAFQTPTAGHGQEYSSNTEQNNYDENSQTIKTVQTRADDDEDKPHYINNGFRPVTDLKNFVIQQQQQQNVGSEYDLEQQNYSSNDTNDSGRRIQIADFPSYINNGHPFLYGINHRRFTGHGLNNQAYSILPISINADSFPNLHGFNDHSLPINPYGPIVLGHLNPRFIKLSGDIMSQLGGGVSQGLANFFKVNQGQSNEKSDGQSYDNLENSTPSEYSDNQMNGKTSDIKQAPVDVELKSVINSGDSSALDVNYGGVDKATDYSSTEADLEQKSIDIGVKTVKSVSSTKTTYNAESSPKSDSEQYPADQYKTSDVEQKSVEITVKGNSANPSYPTGSYGSSKSNVEQKPVKISLKTDSKNSYAHGHSDNSDPVVDYDKKGNSGAPKYSDSKEEDSASKVEQRMDTEQKIYKDVKNIIKTSLKDLAPDGFESLFKSDAGYEGEGNDDSKDSGHSHGLKTKPYPVEQEPKSGGYGNSRPSLVRNNYARNSGVGSSAPSKYPSRNNAQSGASGTRFFNIGSANPSNTRLYTRPSIGAVPQRTEYDGARNHGGSNKDDYSNPGGLGPDRKFRITPGHSRNGDPKPPVYSEVRSVHEEDSAPKYQEPAPHRPSPPNYPSFPPAATDKLSRDNARSSYRRGPPSRPISTDYSSVFDTEEYPDAGEKSPRSPPPRYPPFPSGRTENPRTHVSYQQRGSQIPASGVANYQQNSGPISRPASTGYSSGIAVEEYPGKKTSPRSPSQTPDAYKRPQPAKPRQRPNLLVLDADSPTGDYSNIGSSNTYPKSEEGRYPPPRPRKSSVKTQPSQGATKSQPSPGGSKNRQDSKTEQKYLPITASLKDTDAGTAKPRYGNTKTLARKEPEVVEQQQQQEEEDDDDLEYLSGGSDSNNLLASLGRGLNNAPSSPSDSQDSPHRSSHDDEHEPSMPYEFEFDIEDEEHGNQYRQEKMDDNGLLTGRYGFQNPEGTFRQVEYEAGKDGFKVNRIRTNEPGTDNVDPADVKYDVVNLR